MPLHHALSCPLRPLSPHTLMLAFPSHRVALCQVVLASPLLLIASPSRRVALLSGRPHVALLSGCLLVGSPFCRVALSPPFCRVALASPFCRVALASGSPSRRIALALCRPSLAAPPSAAPPLPLLANLHIHFICESREKENAVVVCSSVVDMCT